MFKLILKNLDEIVQVTSEGEKFRSGENQDKLIVLKRKGEDGLFLSINHEGKIAEFGYVSEKGEDYFKSTEKIMDCVGKSLLPGLIDSHTHPIWSGDRLFEFEMKLNGCTYLDIHEKGGGIFFTVENTRKSSLSELKSSFENRLKSMFEEGTTCVEVKTGYGLDTETEIKMLDVINEVKDNGNQLKPDLVTTFCGAHAIPRGMTSEEGVKIMIEMMDEIKKRNYSIDFIDCFCEKGVFNVEESKLILTHGKKLFNADINFHGDELSDNNCGVLAGEIGAKSVSHLEFLNDKGIESMSKAGTVGIICPLTAYLLRLNFPPVRKMINASIPIVIATDFNPNCHCYSLPIAMNFACINGGLSLNEVLNSVTINAAYALNKLDVGSIEIGKFADCILLNTSNWSDLVYQLGNTRNLIDCVIKKGNVYLSK